MVMLKKFCCGCSLKTGAAFIGFIGLISWMVILILDGSGINTGSGLQYSVIIAVVSFVFLCGVYFEVRILVLGWLLFVGVLTMFAIVTIPLTVGVCFRNNTPWISAAILSAGALGICVDAYFLYVVCSFYETIGGQLQSSGIVV